MFSLLACSCEACCQWGELSRLSVFGDQLCVVPSRLVPIVFFVPVCRIGDFGIDRVDDFSQNRGCFRPFALIRYYSRLVLAHKVFDCRVCKVSTCKLFAKG